MELRDALTADDFRQRHLGLGFLERNRHVMVKAEFSHRHQFHGHVIPAVKFLENRLAQAFRQLPRAIVAEIEKHDQVLRCQRCGTRADGRLDEFIAAIFRISLTDGRRRIRGRGALPMDDSIEGTPSSLPTAIAVHCVISAADRVDGANTLERRLQFGQVVQGASGWHISSIGKHVNVRRGPLAPG